MKSLPLALFAILIGMPSAHAEAQAPLKDALRGLISMSEAKCPQMSKAIAKHKADGNEAIASGIQDGYKNLCVCVPNEAKTLLATLNQKDLDKVINGQQLQTFIRPLIVEKCAAAQFKSTYGESCIDRFKGKVSNPEPYCKCMSDELGKITDSDLASIGELAADYLPLAAKARQAGTPPPEQPSLLKSFFSMEKQCKSK